MDSSRWTTADEIAFINNLGTGRFGNRAQLTNRTILLKGYIAGLRQRREWSGMDALKVLKHALNQLDHARERRLIASKLSRGCYL
jgi:hypothetical protein